jgi:hypothetical protein
MNKPTCCLSSLFVFSFLFLGNAATAETIDLLNLPALTEGAAFSPADNVVVGKEEKTGIKFLSGVEGEGMLKIPVNLTGDFEILIKIKYYSKNSNDCCGSSSRYISLLLTGEEKDYQVALGIWGYSSSSMSSSYKDKHVILTAGKDKSTDASDSWKSSDTANVVKLSVVGTMAKVYVNEVFSQKLPLKTGMTYTLLRFGKLTSTDQLYELTLTSTSGSVVTPPSSKDFDAGKQAGIQQCVTDPASCGIAVTSSCATSPVASGSQPTDPNKQPVSDLEPAADEVPIDYYRDDTTGDVWGQQAAWQLPSPTGKLPADLWKYGLRSIYLAKYACQDASIRDWMPTNIANGVYYCTNPQDKTKTINYLRSLADKLEKE